MLRRSLTTRIKGYPFKLVLAGEPPSAVLSDRVKSLDWRIRRAKRKGAVSSTELSEVRAKIRVLIDNASSTAMTLERLVQKAQKSEVLLYMVGC